MTNVRSLLQLKFSLHATTTRVFLCAFPGARRIWLPFAQIFSLENSILCKKQAILSVIYLTGNWHTAKIQTKELSMKNLGAEANHERECHRRHLEIWRENEAFVTWYASLRISNQSFAFPFAWLMMVEVVRNNFEDLFPEIKEAIEQSVFVGE